jgi:hypothetical protein
MYNNTTFNSGITIRIPKAGGYPTLLKIIRKGTTTMRRGSDKTTRCAGVNRLSNKVNLA